MSDLVWIKHDGGPMPVPGDTLIRVATTSGYRETAEDNAGTMDRADFWAEGNGGGDYWADGKIVEYAIVTPSPSAADTVNNPAHYASGDIECIDAIKAQMTPDQFAGYLRGNVVKYLWRYEQKGGAESLAKGEWYLKRLIQEVRNDG